MAGGVRARVLGRGGEFDLLDAAPRSALFPEGEPQVVGQRALGADPDGRLVAAGDQARLAGRHVLDHQCGPARPGDVVEQQGALDERRNDVGMRDRRDGDDQQQADGDRRPAQCAGRARDGREADRADEPGGLLDDRKHQLGRVLVLRVLGRVREREAAREPVFEARVGALHTPGQHLVAQPARQRREDVAEDHRSESRKEEQREDPAHVEGQPQRVIREEEADQRDKHRDQGARDAEDAEDRAHAPP